MKKLLFALAFLAGCQGQSDGGGNEAVGRGGAGSAARPVQGRPDGKIATLTGLYEGAGQAGPTSRLCMVDPAGETAQFGLVVWGSNDHSCSGSGTATRSAGRVQLKMTGDEACTIEARIEGNMIVLPNSVPEGCAYYCGERARMDGARFTQVGTGRDDAAKAKDLVGDSLC
ncbi:MAG TPA: hypothetical protein VF631_14870 [Allosphingosinicella sp.]|jgi:hypothetical protein|uniref:hypothetical protein n=1 Tax=Allosphingosinicella sp. TaxID=2823234 RepID=UPI002F26ECD5